jgi:nicotinamidase-related amidase
MNKIKFICVDFQKDFTSEGGKAYKSRPSVDFVKETLVPFFRKHNIKTAEIISDYRAPRSGSTAICRPGEVGFESELPDDIKIQDIRIKSMNSPLWSRANCGVADQPAGIPFQDSDGFAKWLHHTVGNPEEVENVILFGLTIDCCVLSTAQELRWR